MFLEQFAEAKRNFQFLFLIIGLILSLPLLYTLLNYFSTFIAGEKIVATISRIDVQLKEVHRNNKMSQAYFHRPLTNYERYLATAKVESQGKTVEFIAPNPTNVDLYFVGQKITVRKSPLNGKIYYGSEGLLIPLIIFFSFGLPLIILSRSLWGVSVIFCGIPIAIIIGILLCYALRFHPYFGVELAQANVVDFENVTFGDKEHSLPIVIVNDGRVTKRMRLILPRPTSLSFKVGDIVNCRMPKDIDDQAYVGYPELTDKDKLGLVAGTLFFILPFIFGFVIKLLFKHF